jgi:hypothetical protein
MFGSIDRSGIHSVAYLVQGSSGNARYRVGDTPHIYQPLLAAANAEIRKCKLIGVGYTDK